jgi:carbonic anhydrase
MMDWRKALGELKDGNKRFMADKSNGEWADAELRAELTEGQNPIAAVLACSDSRVAPQIVFDARLGDLFTVKVAGNVAGKSAIASIEFAVEVLEVELVVVIGHEGCGAVNAALHGGFESPNLSRLLRLIQPAVEACSSGRAEDVVRLNAHLAADRCIRESRILTEAVQSDKLHMATAYYHLESGLVEFDE